MFWQVTITLCLENYTQNVQKHSTQTFLLRSLGLTLSLLLSGSGFRCCCSASVLAKEPAVMVATGVLWTRVSLLWATLLPVKSSPCSGSSLVAVLARDATGTLVTLLGLLRWGPWGLVRVSCNERTLHKSYQATFPPSHYFSRPSASKLIQEKSG